MEYLQQCRLLYQMQVTPSDEATKNHPEYLRLVATAKTYFVDGRLKDFMRYFQEGQYFVQLWTAHLVIDYGNSNAEEKNLCLDEIRKYACGSLSPKVRAEEAEWLIKNL